MKSPAFGLDGEIRPSVLNVDEGDEDVGGSGLSWLGDTSNELSELIGVHGRACVRKGRGIEGIVDDLNGRRPAAHGK